ncbi:MAG: NAD-binding protein [Burkholderiales bacterium]
MAEHYIPAAALPKHPYMRFVWGVIALAAIMAIGSIGYKIIGGEKATWIDCIYMTFITIASIGYGEIIDLSNSPGGRVFTMFIGFAGIGVATYLLSTFTAFLLEGKINEALWRNRMEKNIHKLNQHFILCGSGRVGRNVANELSATNRSYVIIDIDLHEIETHLEKHPNTLYVHGDATDDDMLIKAHVATATGIFAITGDDGRNLMITITARQLNPHARIVARCHEVRNIEKLRKAGADAIVSPDFTGGMRIVSSMVRPQVVSFLDEMLRSDKNLRVEEIHLPPSFRETTIGALNLHHNDYIVLALREKDAWRFNPGTDAVLKPGATLVVMATPGGRQMLEKRFAQSAAFD